MKKILTCVITAILLMTSLLLGGCDRLRSGSEMEYGDFYYCYVAMADDNRMRVKGDYVAITRLTEEGKQKDTIIIPDEIDGKPVIQIGITGFAFSYSPDSGKYTRIYLPNTILSISNNNFDGRAIVLGEPSETFFKRSGLVFVSKNVYDKYSNSQMTLGVAMVNYIVDGETYWLDDNNSYKEALIYCPPEPEKEGYVFAGWYKEPECINKWDFETDTVPPKILDETGRDYLYIPTNLYAKWL